MTDALSENGPYGRLIDYAGVFPPAEHPLDEALTRYSAARRSPHGWMLGPFLVRASELPDDIDVPELGVVVDAPLPATDLPIRQTEARARPDQVDDVITTLSTHADTVFIESNGDEPGDVIDAVAAARTRGHDARAKIRTGGAGAVPAVDTVATFIRRCVDTAVPFKATAGLHHALRAPGTGGVVEHGFVNLLAAVRVALVGGPVEACLSDGDDASFAVADAVWRGFGVELPTGTVRDLFSGFGSCSFDEPVASLERVGGLAAPRSRR